MPSRNVFKPNAELAYYHIYARGANKQKIFADNQDYRHFEGLFGRYLAKDPAFDSLGTPYPHYLGQVELLAYCLMQNHFHLLLYQIRASSMEKLMRSVMTSYSRYFNLRHRRTGPLFESRYKAVLVDEQSYLEHISRYIHLNPRFWQTYRYSSLRYYRNGNRPEWLHPAKILAMFESSSQYLDFVADYEKQQRTMEHLKHYLADH